MEGKDFSKLEHNDKRGCAALHRLVFDVLRGGTQCLAGLEEGFRSVELIEACRWSAAADGSIIAL